MYRIDARSTGDVSAEIGERGKKGKPNPNSAMIWHYGGVDLTGDVTGNQNEIIFNRTISTVAVTNGLVFAADIAGYVHCVDLKSGTRIWKEDAFDSIWSSPLVVDKKIFLGTENGELLIMSASREKKTHKSLLFDNGILGVPTIANGKLIIGERSKLHVFDLRGK